MQQSLSHTAILIGGIVCAIGIAALMMSDSIIPSPRKTTLDKHQESIEPIGGKVISVAETLRLLLVTPAPTVIDVRAPHAFAREHIIGALSVTDTMIAKNTLPPTNNAVIIVGDPDSAQTMRTVRIALTEEGKDVSILDGGMDAWVAVGAPTIRASLSPSGEDRQKVVSIDSQEAALLINKGAAVVDVRTAEQFTQRHIPSAISLPLQNIERDHAVIPLSAPYVIVYGTNDDETTRAAAQLFDLGFFNVVGINGGFTAWGGTGEQK